MALNGSIYNKESDPSCQCARGPFSGCIKASEEVHRLVIKMPGFKMNLVLQGVTI